MKRKRYGDDDFDTAFEFFQLRADERSNWTNTKIDVSKVVPRLPTEVSFEPVIGHLTCVANHLKKGPENGNYYLLRSVTAY